MKRTVSEQQKIVRFARSNSIKEAAVLYQVSYASIYRWQKLHLQNKEKTPLSLCPALHTQPEINIRINFLAEYCDSFGNYKQIYQLTATDKNSGEQYTAFSIERNKTVVDIYKEYLKYCYRQAGVASPLIHCSYYRPEFKGYDTPDTIKSKKKSQLELLAAYLRNNPDLNNYSKLLPVAYAAQIMNSSNNHLHITAGYPVFIKCAYLKTLVTFKDQNQAWDQLINTEYRHNLLKKALEYLESEAVSSYRRGNSSRSLEIYNQMLNFHGCQQHFPGSASRFLIAKARIHNQKNEHDLAIAALQSALQLIPGQAEVYYQLANVYHDQHNLSLAENSLQLALEIYKTGREPQAKCRYYESQGILHYRYKADNSRALSYFAFMKKIALQISDLTLLYEANGYMANIHYLNRNYRKALVLYSENEILAAKLCDDNLKATVFYALSITHKELNNLPEALEYQDKSLLLALRFGNRERIIYAHLEKGRIQLAQSELNKADSEFRYALKLHQQYEIKNQTTLDILNNLGTVYRKEKRYRLAKKQFEECIKVAKSLKITDNLIYYHIQIADICRLAAYHQLAVAKYKTVLKMAGKEARFLQISAISAHRLAELYFNSQQYAKCRPLLISAQTGLTAVFSRNPLPVFTEMLTAVNKMQSALPC